MKDHILILGTGALATLFAYRLAGAGYLVTMLGSWSEGLKALREGGARLEGAGSYPVKATDDPRECRGVKFALVLVKSWQTENAARQLANCLVEDGLALTLQNGLGNDEILIRALGKERVALGVTTLGASLVGPGCARLAGEGSVSLENLPSLSGLAEILRVATFEVRIVEDAKALVWGKLVVSTAINPLTALLKVPNGKLLDIPDARQLMGELALETAKVARMSGVGLLIDNPVLEAETVAHRTGENRSSMLQDVLRGAPTEIDVINGAVVKKGGEVNVATPVNEVMWRLVRSLRRS